MQTDFAVVLVDVVAPAAEAPAEQACFALARLIRGCPRSERTPVLFLAASLPTADMLQRGHALGDVDWHLKPLGAPVLAARVQLFCKAAQRYAAEYASIYNTLQPLIKAFGYDAA